MFSKRKLTVTAALAAVLTLNNCGTAQNTIPAGQLYNHWIAYCYVLPGQNIDSRFANTGSISYSSYMVIPHSSINLNGFLINEDKTIPWDILDIQWSPKSIGAVNIVPLSITLSTNSKKINLSLGEWHLNVIKSLQNYPLKIDSQSVGETLIEMPSSYAFSIKLTSIQPIDLKTLSVESNAPDKFLNMKINRITQSKNQVDIEGTVNFLNTTNQIYLIPALHYKSNGRQYDQPLLPMVFSVFPSESTGKFSDHVTL